MQGFNLVLTYLVTRFMEGVLFVVYERGTFSVNNGIYKKVSGRTSRRSLLV